MALFTLFSRILGLVRNQLLSHFFGSGLVADAFVAAFTIPNALRRLFGEGALTPALVTTFTRALKGPDWKGFLNAAFAWTSIALCLLSGIGILAAEFLVGLYVPEFKNVPGKFELSVQLTRFLFPFILFIGWSAFFMGILNSLRHFGVPAFGPAALNITVIVLVPLCFLFFNIPSDYRIFIFGGALLMGGLIQAVIQIPTLIRLKAFPGLKFQWFDPRVMELGRILIPSAFAMGVYQLNIIVNRVFASGIDGAVSHLFYADLIIELPISLIAVSLGTAVLPSFSRLISENKRADLAQTFSFSLESVWLLALPCMLGVMVLATPITSTLYFSGKFQLSDLGFVSQCLVSYAIGLPFFAGLRIISPLFFAAKDMRTPALIGFVALGVNLVTAWKFSQSLGAHGIALATSISSAVNFLILGSIALSRHPEIRLLPVLKIVLKIVSATLAMAILIYGAEYWLRILLQKELWLEKGISPLKVVCLFLLVSLGGISYFAFCSWLKIPQAESLLRKIRGRFTGAAGRS